MVSVEFLSEFSEFMIYFVLQSFLFPVLQAKYEMYQPL